MRLASLREIGGRDRQRFRKRMESVENANRATLERTGHGGETVFMTSIVEFRAGKIVRQPDDFAGAFEAPASRSQWVQPMAAAPTA